MKSGIKSKWTVIRTLQCMGFAAPQRLRCVDGHWQANGQQLGDASSGAPHEILETLRFEVRSAKGMCFVQSTKDIGSEVLNVKDMMKNHRRRDDTDSQNFMKIHLKNQEIAPRCCSVFSLRKGHCAFCPWRSVEVKNDPQQYSDKELAADVDKRRAGLLALKHLPVVIEGEQEAANPADALASAGWEAAGTADGRDFIRCPFCLRTHIVQSFAYRIVNEEDNLCTATTCACFDKKKTVVKSTS